MRILLRCDGAPRIGVGHVVRSLALAEVALARGHAVGLLGRVEGPLLTSLADRTPGLTLLGPAGGGRPSRRRWPRATTWCTSTTTNSAPTTCRRLTSARRGRTGRCCPTSSTAGSAPARRTCSSTRPSGPSARTRRRRPVAPAREPVHAGACQLAALARLRRRTRQRRRPGARGARRHGRHRPGRLRAARRRGARAGWGCRSTSPSCPCPRPPRRSARWPPVVGRSAARDPAGEPTCRRGWRLRTSSSPLPERSTWELCALRRPMALVAAATTSAPATTGSSPPGAPSGWAGWPTWPTSTRPPPGCGRCSPTAACAERVAAAAHRLVDGRGAWRVVSMWEAARTASAAPAPTVRRSRCGRRAWTTRARCSEWRNDPVTRAVSRHHGVVPLDDHLTWLRAALERPDRHLLVGSLDGVDVGTVRWDLEGDREWEVSITVAPEARGRGLAAALLRAGERWLSGSTVGGRLPRRRARRQRALATAVRHGRLRSRPPGGRRRVRALGAHRQMRSHVSGVPRSTSRRRCAPRRWRRCRSAGRPPGGWTARSRAVTGSPARTSATT